MALLALNVGLGWAPRALAAPTADAGDAAGDSGASLTTEEREKLKAEIKAELAAEMEAERTAQEGTSPEGAKHAESRPLMPEGQDTVLGKHAVANDHNTYKPGSGLHLEANDGSFALTTRLRVQLRQQLGWTRDENETELEQLFQLRRARLQFKGHAFNPHNKFKVELAFSPRDLGVLDGVLHNTPLLTWYLEFDYLRDFTIRAGQYKIPFSRQRVTSSGDLQLVDRSIANGEFNHDRDIGLDVRSKDIGGLGGYLRYYAGVYMGEGRDFGGKNATPDFSLQYLGRVEVLPMGKFKDYKEADIERSPSPKLSLGGTYAFHHRAQGLRGTVGDRPADGGTTNYHSVEADYHFKFAGFSSLGEVHWRRGKRIRADAGADPTEDGTSPLAPVTAPRDGYGFHIQAGYVFPRTRLEIAARYAAVRALGKRDPGDLRRTAGYTSLSRKDSAGGGVSYYFAGHPWKLQADYFRTWRQGDIGGGENLVRVQLQLAF